MGKSLKQVVKKFDRFGHTMGLNYEGSSSYKTLFGSCSSIFVYILILINASNILMDFMNNDNQKEVNRRVDAKIEDLGAWNVQDSMLIMAILKPPKELG